MLELFGQRNKLKPCVSEKGCAQVERIYVKNAKKIPLDRGKIDM